MELYNYSGGERVTPEEEIPDSLRLVAVLPGGRKQILRKDRCYNWVPGDNGGRYVECASVASHAETGFVPPKRE